MERQCDDHQHFFGEKRCLGVSENGQAVCFKYKGRCRASHDHQPPYRHVTSKQGGRALGPARWTCAGVLCGRADLAGAGVDRRRARRHVHHAAPRRARRRSAGCRAGEPPWCMRRAPRQGALAWPRLAGTRMAGTCAAYKAGRCAREHPGGQKTWCIAHLRQHTHQHGLAEGLGVRRCLRGGRSRCWRSTRSRATSSWRRARRPAWRRRRCRIRSWRGCAWRTWRVWWGLGFQGLQCLDVAGSGREGQAGTSFAAWEKEQLRSESPRCPPG